MTRKKTKTIRACFEDTVQHASSRAYVLQLHLVLDFDRRLVVPHVRGALRLILDREPVFGSRFVCHWFRPCWQRMDREILEAAPLLQEISGDRTALARAREDFLTDSLEAESGPQLRGILLHRADGDTLIIKVNHQVVDAGGTKELGYLFAEIYRNLEKNGNYQLGPNPGSRSLWQVYGQLGWRRLIRLFPDFFRETRRLILPFQTLSFPSGTCREGRWRFCILRFEADRVKILRSFCRKRQATLNDLLVAAFLRAVAEITGWQQDRTLRLVTTVDLRRYLPERKAAALCNLSGFFFPNLGQDLGADLDQTLQRVKQHIDAHKKGDIGLSVMFVDRLLYLPLPYIALRGLMNRIMNAIANTGNLVPVLTNLGPIDEESLDIGGVRPVAAEVLAPPIVPPFFGLGLSGYRGSLTLSCAIYPSAIPLEQIQTLFAVMDRILPSQVTAEE